MEMKEPHVCKLNFLVMKRLLNSRKPFFHFSGSHLPPPANSHEAFENQNYYPTKKKQNKKTQGHSAKEVEGMEATNYGIGGGVGRRRW